MQSSDELILRGGTIYTLDPGRPVAKTLTVRNGKISAVGESREIENPKGASARIIDLEGGFLLPAFSDLHTHFFLGAQGEEEIDLRDISGREEFRERVKAAVASLEPGEWLTGGYWNETQWEDGDRPDKTWLDDIAPRNPVLLYRHDLHNGLCNEMTLKTVGIDASAPDPVGGTIVRDTAGKPTGILLEKALTQVRDHVPPLSGERRIKALKQGMWHANSLGLTSISDIIESPEDAELYLALQRAEQLTCRFELLPPLPHLDEFIAAGLRFGEKGELVRIGPMKGFIDGSLGSRTALMSEPYDDDPGNRGMTLEKATPPERMLEMMTEADREGYTLAIHAIGDEANSILIGLYERLKESSRNPGRRHRVEHAQHLCPELVKKLAESGLIISMQPYHLFFDGCYAEAAIGSERSRYTFAFRSLMEAGAVVAFGSDWPVVDLNPLLGIEAAVTRRTADGRHPGGWVPDQKIGVEQAVRAYTCNNSLARGDETRLGMLRTGFDADMVLLDRDIFTCGPEEIGSARVQKTFLRGRQVYPEVWQ